MAVRVRGWSIPRPDARTLVGIGLAAVAAVAVLWMTQPVPTVPVLVAASDLPAGTPLSRLDLTVRHATDPTGMVTQDAETDQSDWVLRTPLAEGEPLLPSLLRPPEVQLAPDLVALDVERSRAVLGRIDPGDRIDVYATASRPGEPPETRLVAASVFVVDSVASESSISGDRIQLLLAVDDELAGTLTAAMNEGALDLVRVGQ